MTGRAAALLAGLLAASPALAEVKLSQSVDRSEVGTEDVFQVTISVTGSEEAGKLSLPSSDDFEVLGQSQSTQLGYQMGPGGMPTVDRMQRIVLRMRANRAGHLTLPGAVLTVGGKTLRAEPVELDVKPGHVKRARRSSQDDDDQDAVDPFASLGVPPMPRGFGRLFRGFGDDDDLGMPDPFGRMGRPSKSDVQLRATLDRKSVYVGEQATLSVYLLARVGLSSLQGLELPKIDGALVEDLDSQKKISGEEKVIDGVRYRVYLIARRALFPLQAGPLEIGPAQVQVTAGNLFAQAQLSPESSPLSLDVKPLPPGGPANGQEAVGEWRLSAEVSPKQAALGEPLTVRVTAEGTGDLKNLPMPRLEAPASVKVYEPTTTDDPRTLDGRLGGKRVQEFTVIPQQTGEFTLPALSLPWFDPKTGKHEVSRTEPLTFTVVAGPGAATVASSATAGTPAPGPKNVIPSDVVRPIRHDASLVPPPPAPWRRPLLGLLLGVPILGWALVELGTALRRNRAGRPRAATSRELERSARRHLSAAEQLKARQQPAEFYAEVERGLNAFVESRLKMRASGLTRDSLAQRLAASGMDPVQRERVLQALEGCQAGRYAPGLDRAAMDQALALARDAMQGRHAR